VDVHFCRTEDAYAISIIDSNGMLSKIKILESIYNTVKLSLLIRESMESGEDITDLIAESGRGLDIVRKLTANYYFITKKNHRTEIILIFKNNDGPTDVEKTSLKIIED